MVAKVARRGKVRPEVIPDYLRASLEPVVLLSHH